MKNKNLLFRSLFFLFSMTLLPWFCFAQETIECQLKRQRIMQLANAPDFCRSKLQQCLGNARYAPNYQMAEADCNMGFGGCQLGGAIGKSLGGKNELDQAIEQYKYQCER
jgi:hypothetical protein